MASDVRSGTDGKVDEWHTQANKRLDFQIKRLAILFDTYRKGNGYDFNDSDSLIIIIQATGTSSFSDFIVSSLADTLKSVNALALSKEVNNGGGRLEPLKEGATEFNIRKRYNADTGEPFLEVTTKSDTAYAFKSLVYSPVDAMSIIVTAKKINGTYKISDYYLHEFAFAPVGKN